MNATRVSVFLIVGGFVALILWGVSLLFLPDWVQNGPVGDVVEWGIFLGIMAGVALACVLGARDILRGR